MPDVQRHADHGPDVACRPAGSGLCEPAPAGLVAWRQALAAQAKERRNRRGKRPGPPVAGVRIPAPEETGEGK